MFTNKKPKSNANSNQKTEFNHTLIKFYIRVGFGVGLGVGFGVIVIGFTVGNDVGLGVGFGVGFGVGIGETHDGSSPSGQSSPISLVGPQSGTGAGLYGSSQ